MSNRKKALQKFHAWRIKQACFNCGNEDWRTHEFHHVNGDTKRANVAVLARQSITAAMREMEKCIVLCANCHRILHHKEK
jgi:hypothetical protein